MAKQVEWVEYKDLSETQKRSVQARYGPSRFGSYYTDFLYRTWQGQLTMTGHDRRRR